MGVDFNNEFGKAVSIFKKAIQIFPDLIKVPFVCGEYATALYESGKSKDAYKYFKLLFKKFKFQHFTISFAECFASQGLWHKISKILSTQSNYYNDIEWAKSELLNMVSNWICSDKCNISARELKQKSAEKWLSESNNTAEREEWDVAFYSALIAAFRERRNADAWECAIVYAVELFENKAEKIIYQLLIIAHQLVGKELQKAAESFALKYIEKDIRESFIKNQKEYIEQLPIFLKRKDIIFISKKCKIIALLEEGYTMEIDMNATKESFVNDSCI